MSRVPQFAVHDQGKDQPAAMASTVDQFNQMITALRSRVKALEAKVAVLEGRLGASAPEVTGSRFTGAALQNLLTTQDAMGLIIDSTTA